MTLFHAFIACLVAGAIGFALGAGAWYRWGSSLKNDAQQIRTAVSQIGRGGTNVSSKDQP